MVIVITGILASVVAVFIRSGVDSYADSARRAELTDTADTVLRRISRDLRLAVPNSVRVVQQGGVVYLELLLAKTGGRYSGSAAENCFITGCSSITTLGSVVETLGTPVAAPAVPGGPAGGRYALASIVGGSDRIVIYNQYSNSGGDCGNDNPSVYCGQNLSTLAATPVTDVPDQDVFNFAGQTFVPLGGSPSQRFQIVDGPVTYACDPGNRQIVRYGGYPLAAVQPTPPAGGSSSLLATHVANCQFDYQQGVMERWGLASLYIQLSERNEAVSLRHEVPINNAP